jgi:hypothetical protein
MEAQNNCIFKDTTKVIKASTTEVIKASATEVIKASTTNAIKALAKGTTAPATIATLAKSTAISIIPIIITKPELLAHITLVYKVIPKVSIYIILNGKTFN